MWEVAGLSTVRSNTVCPWLGFLIEGGTLTAESALFEECYVVCLAVDDSSDQCLFISKSDPLKGMCGPPSLHCCPLPW